MGEGNMFAVSYIWSIPLPDGVLKLTGIAVCHVQNGKLVEEWGAGGTLPPEGS